METELTRLKTIELAAIRASMELIGNNKMDAIVVGEFVNLLMKQIDKIEKDELIYRKHLNDLSNHYRRNKERNEGGRNPLGRVKTYNMKEASELLQVTYRTIRYYKDIFTNEVTQEGRDVQLSERFIELVKNNRKPREPKQKMI